MGKKDGINGNFNADVENAEPNLPTILEEEQEEHPEEPRKSLKSAASEPRSKSSLKSRSKSNTGLEEDKSEKRKSEPNGNTSESEIIPEIQIETQKTVEEKEGSKGNKGKVKKGKKGKKEKSEAPELSDEEVETQPKKSKKKNKEKLEGGESEETKPKKGKKGKKQKFEASVDNEITSEQASIEKKVEVEPVEGEDAEKQGKKSKKGKKEKLEKKEKPEKNEKTTDSSGNIEKKGKVKKEKGAKVTKIDDEHFDHERRKSERRLRERQSRVSFSSIIMEEEKSGVERKSGGSKEDSSKVSLGIEASDNKISRKQKRKSTLKSEGSGILFHGVRKLRAWTSASRFSTDTDSLSFESYLSGDREREEQRKKKKGKKDKKQKGERTNEEEKKSEEDLAKKEQKKAEKKALKEAKKEEKKLAKLAAKQAAKEQAALTKKAKVGTEMDYDEVKKKLEELKKMAKEMGIDYSKEEEGEEGPKKKLSKKEKARLTAEMAEKAKAELEAQARRMEELIRKRKEEERLAAIEQDKRETIEYGIRMEQLAMSNALIQDIIDTNAEITRKEQELVEWQKYVECGNLPNASMCDQMNTYLHLWELVLEQTSMEIASKMTRDAIKLLSDMDELIDTVTEEEKRKLENWKWVRQLFKEYQASSLDVATYRLLRDVEHNLNRINIPTADFNFKDDYVTLCIWLRVMLPIPLPNPRRPPKPRIDINFSEMDFSVLFPTTIDCENAAIRAMYLKYDHLSDLCKTFHLPEVPEDYHMDLLSISKKEWRTKLKYKYENRDRKKFTPPQEIQQDSGSSPEIQMENPEQTPVSEEKHEVEKKEGEEEKEIASDEEIPIVPFKQLKPTSNEYACIVEDQLYNDTRAKLLTDVPEHVINLRKFVILGGVYHLNLFAQPPQPQDFITMEMTITGLYLPKKLEAIPYKVVYTPYIPPEPEPTDSSSSLPRKLPEELEEEQKKQDEELDKLISINIKWPQHVIFLELPMVCRWDENEKQWSKEEIHDLKHNEEKCILSFRTGVFGIYGMATYRYANLPFQAYDIKPEIDGSVTVQLTAAILMLEFSIKDGLISITQLQNSPNTTLQDVVGKFFKLHQLKRVMKEAGIDIFPAFDAFCYVDGCCEKQWAMEQHLYYNMAQMANRFNFSWSRWNLQAGRRKIVLQMRQYSVENKKQKSHQMLLVSPLKAAFIECTEVSQTFSEKEVESMKFCADLYHLMKNTCGIFVRNKVMKASKQNVNALAQFLIAIRIMSFS